MARRKSSRGRVLVSETGRKNYKNIKMYKEKIRNDNTLSELEKRAKIADLEDYINERVRHNKTHFIAAGETATTGKLTTNGFEGFEKGAGLERMFANVGMSAEEIAMRYELDENELLDPSNWSGDVFTDSAGNTHIFKFSYTGEIF